MSMAIPQKLKKIISLFSLFALASASFFTVCHLFTAMPEMAMGEHMDSMHVSVSASTSCCQNTGVNRSLRLNIVHTLTNNINLGKGIFALLLFLTAFITTGFLNLNSLLKFKVGSSRYRDYRFNNYIFTALSGGILQPKLYHI